MLLKDGALKNNTTFMSYIIKTNKILIDNEEIFNTVTQMYNLF